ncbi:ribosomal protein S15 [Pneumocystis jirovecii RU7]|uniref:Ribosomal protein S15 n=1 Tax=Pneumocystis jirovecii (strain RU7) TaxID=1408657 RepID=A0A0W4ZFT1_PNEJ7|nr:ribosomal protein S15 [Pneumocystis jirovecii RU7]KTW27244.1 ribosomal protein S15 [Pneumocystis jirovecii RU7]
MKFKKTTLEKKILYQNVQYFLLRFSKFHNISAKWKQSLISIQRRKKNIEKQRKLKEERAAKLCDPIIAFPTEFTRSILYPKDVFTETSSFANYANFFFSNEELNTILKSAKKANLYRVGLSSSMMNKNNLAKLKEKISKYVDITEETDIQSLLEILSKNDKVQETLDSNNNGDKKNHIIIELASIYKIQRICKQEDKKAEIIKKIVSLKNSNSKAIQLQNISMAIEQFKQHETDTGSPEVQAAIFTVRIHYLNSHLSFHRKDKNTFRALRHLVHKRQKILKYLRKEDHIRYFSCIKKLGLTDTAIINEITM